MPEQDAPGPKAVPIPAAEGALLLADRQEQRPEAEEAVPPLPEALLPEVPLGELVREAAQGAQQEAVPKLLIPGLEIIIMKQDILPADMAEDAKDRILGKLRLAA